MGRKHKKAVIYKLTNKKTGRVYIGETTNFKDRMSYYKTTEQRANNSTMGSIRPIDYAILDFGFDNFDIDVIRDEDELIDNSYRMTAEDEEIDRYHADDPRYGYNIMGATTKIKARVPIESTKVTKSKPIVVYRISDGDMCMYMSSKTFAKELGVDRAQVARSARNGKAVHGYYIFSLDVATRDANAYAIIHKKKTSHDKTGAALKTLAEYEKAYKAVIKYCRHWGIE